MNVQLKHDAKETDFADRVDHGFVALYIGDKLISRRDGFQHNVNLRKGGAWDSSAVEALVAEVTKALESPSKSLETSAASA